MVSTGTFVVLGISLLIVLAIFIGAFVSRYRQRHQTQPQLPVTQTQPANRKRRVGDDDTAWAYGVPLMVAS
jgi:Na+-transporting methylmalonyl-CoA/oxaloacetate decarboxylase gamma subunit